MTFLKFIFLAVVVGSIALFFMRMKRIRDAKSRLDSMSIQEAIHIAKPVFASEIHPKLSDLNQPHINPELYAFNRLFNMAIADERCADMQISYRDEQLCIGTIRSEVQQKGFYLDCTDSYELEKIWFEVMRLTVQSFMEIHDQGSEALSVELFCREAV